MLSTVTMLFAPAVAVEPDEDYATIMGVLTSDYYTLYPFEATSVDFGISKYGEMIDGAGLKPDVGLQYPGYEDVETHDQNLKTSRDPFASEYVEKELWLNGWLLEIRYTHRTEGARTVVSMAMSADMATYGGEWLNGHDPDLYAPPHGGRKSSGYVETEDLEVLYDGPRKYVAICRNHIYDWIDTDEDDEVDHPDETIHMIDFYLTFIFNKVKKYVIILKDVKLIMSGKALVSPVEIQLSDREEWDLGPSPSLASYAHFYHQIFETCYGTEENSDVHLAPGIMREYKTKGVGEIPGVNVTPDTCWGPPIVDGSVWVFVEGEWMEPGVDYDIDVWTGDIDWYTVPGEEDTVEVYYKLWKGEWDPTGEIFTPYEGVPHLYDVAQIISDDEDEPEYIGWKAFWPTLSDYTVDGWAVALEPLINVGHADMSVEPEIPFVIGEWDTMLGKGYPQQFRGVEVCGISDWNSASDISAYNDGRDWADDINTLDVEAAFQLDEVFNPWDLYSAVHKKNTRWVEFFEYDDDFDDTDPDIVLLSYTPVLDPNMYPDPRYDPKEWYSYCSFAERVLLIRDGNETLLIPQPWGDDYAIDYANGEIIFDPDGESDTLEDGFEEGDIIKVLYSTDATSMWSYEMPENQYTFGPGRYEWFVVGRDAASVDSAGAGLVTAAFKQKFVTIGLGGEDMMDPELANMFPSVMHQFGEDDAMADYMDDLGRMALKDDWCTFWPVSSSNLIGVGGALANGLAYYGNDFTDAFYAMPEYASSTWDGMITGATCWQRGWASNDGEWNVYASDDDTGYAVITTYKDINGTVIFLVWGHWGRDTYYATQWLHGDVARGITPGIVQLQHAPRCLTSIILEIDYEDPDHPEFSIVEALGTITEFDWTHDYYNWLIEDDVEEDKGGIHDP